jgi:S1-C subfamily serine protease
MSTEDKPDPGAAAQPATPATPSEGPSPRASSRDMLADALAAASLEIKRRASEKGDDAPEDLDEDERDALDLAALVLQRFRTRARTDLAELRVHYQRLDGLVLVAALTIVIAASVAYRTLVTPPAVLFEERGLSFLRSSAWLPPEPVAPIAARIHRGDNLRPSKGLPYHAAFESALEDDVRMEVQISEHPRWSNLVTGLEIERRTRWGELYRGEVSTARTIGGHDWLRTPFRHAFVGEKTKDPRVGTGLEYAGMDRDQLYVITFFGSPEQLAVLEKTVVPTLRLKSRTGLPLLPQVGKLGRRSFPPAVGSAFQSTVMVATADMVDGRLVPVGGGSGVIVSRDGSILTNFHVLHDRDGRLHDVFFIGRFTGLDHPPELICAGRPSRSKLHPEVDLALIKCDTDLDGRARNRASWERWLTTPVAQTKVEPGQRVWVLGFADVGGGGATLSQGLVEGQTSEEGLPGSDYLKTDASITHGNSGGPVVDDNGSLVGIATAFRIRVNAAGGSVQIASVGLVRPLSAAADLLGIAAAGWTPREGKTSVELEPTALDAPAEGIHISTRILDGANKNPVAGALLMVLRPGVTPGEVDMNRLDELVLAWGRAGSDGEVHLKQPVPTPGSYTVMVMARGYEPLIGDAALKLEADSPPFFDPWGFILIESR